MNVNKVLILGSKGQIGAYLTDYINEHVSNADGEKMRVLEYDMAIDPSMDLRIPNEPQLNEMMYEADFVFFLAFDVGGSRYLKYRQHSYEYIDNNMLLMHNTFNALRAHDKPFIFASSQMSN